MDSQNEISGEKKTMKYSPFLLLQYELSIKSETHRIDISTCLAGCQHALYSHTHGDDAEYRRPFTSKDRRTDLDIVEKIEIPPIMEIELYLTCPFEYTC